MEISNRHYMYGTWLSGAMPGHKHLWVIRISLEIGAMSQRGRVYMRLKRNGRKVERRNTGSVYCHRREEWSRLFILVSQAIENWTNIVHQTGKSQWRRGALSLDPTQDAFMGRIWLLVQCFSKCDVHTNNLEIISKCRFWSSRPWGQPESRHF